MKAIVVFFMALLLSCVVPVKVHSSSAEEMGLGVDDKPLARIAILPLENLSDSNNASKNISPVLREMLVKRGYDLVNMDDLSDFLCEERVRSTGFVSNELSRKIREKFDVAAIIAGSVISYTATDKPDFGIFARMIDSSDGRILWADIASATGEDYTTILELGRISDISKLVPKVMNSLFASFDPDVLNSKTEPVQSVAVMPFKNNSGFKNAGVIAMHMFIVELLKSREFRPIEYGNIRNSIIDLRIRNKGELSYFQLNSLSDALDVRGFLVGVVDTYKKGVDVSSPPRVGMTVRLVHGSSNKILWYNSDQRSGEDLIVAFDWGRVRSVHSLAYQSVSSLVGKMGTSELQ